MVTPMTSKVQNSLKVLRNNRVLNLFKLWPNDFNNISVNPALFYKQCNREKLFAFLSLPQCHNEFYKDNRALTHVLMFKFNFYFLV